MTAISVKAGQIGPNYTNFILFFLHIPKTGGTSFKTLLDRKFQPFEIFDFNVEAPEASLDQIQSLSPERQAQIKCVRGHMPLGLHCYFSKPAVYVTLVRDPVERLISHYYHVLWDPAHEHHDTVTSEQMTLEDYVCSDITTELSNGQTRLISGFEEPEPTLATLALAKENLKKHFILAGLTERFDDSLILLALRLGWPGTCYLTINRAMNKPQKMDIPDRVIEKIRERNQLDLALYDFITQRFEDEIAAYRESFQIQRARFDFSNEILRESIEWIEWKKRYLGNLGQSID